MQILLIASAYYGEIKRLGVDGKLVLAELNDVLAIHIQFLFIFELADCLFVNGLKLGLDALCLAGFAKVGKFLHTFIDRINQPIGCHVAIDIANILEGA